MAIVLINTHMQTQVCMTQNNNNSNRNSNSNRNINSKQAIANSCTVNDAQWSSQIVELGGRRLLMG